MATEIINHIILMVNISTVLNSSPKSQSHHECREWRELLLKYLKEALRFGIFLEPFFLFLTFFIFL